MLPSPESTVGGFAALLDLVADVQRATVTKTATGETQRAFSVIASAVPFAVQQGRGRKIQVDAGQTLQAEWIAFCGVSVDVRPADRLAEATQGTRLFEVLLVDNIRGHHLELRLRSVNVP